MRQDPNQTKRHSILNVIIIVIDFVNLISSNRISILPLDFNSVRGHVEPKIMALISMVGKRPDKKGFGISLWVGNY